MGTRKSASNHGLACPYCGAPLTNPRYTNCPNCGGLLQGMSAHMQRQAPGPDWSNAQTVPLAPVVPKAAPRAPQKPPNRPRRRRGGHGWLGCVVPIIVALLLLAAAGTAGAYYLFNAVIAPGGSSQPHSRVLVQPTSAPTATATALPTDTPSPQPTATLPAPTTTPAPTLHTLFQDPLTANTNGWFEDSGNALFEADGYHIRNAYVCYAPVTMPANVNVSVDAASVKSQPGVYGIAYRVTDNRGRFYAFWITQDGYWGVMNAQAGAVIASRKTSAIHTGYGVFNHMEVRASGRRFMFFINDVQVGSASDGAYASGGAGLTVESVGQEAIFKNFRITEWQ